MINLNVIIFLSQKLIFKVILNHSAFSQSWVFDLNLSKICWAFFFQTFSNSKLIQIGSFFRLLHFNLISAVVGKNIGNFLFIDARKKPIVVLRV